MGWRVWMEGIVILAPFEFLCLGVNENLVQHPNLITLKNNACSKINLFGANVKDRISV